MNSLVKTIYFKVILKRGIYIAIYKVKTLLKVCLKGYIRIPQDMQNSVVKKKNLNFWMIFGLKSPELIELIFG